MVWEVFLFKIRWIPSTSTSNSEVDDFSKREMTSFKKVINCSLSTYLMGMKNGGGEGHRTLDPAVMSRVLYH